MFPKRYGGKMIFYTDIQTIASNYCLLNIKKYDDPRRNNKKIVFVDPDVMSLRTHSEYPLIDKLLWLANGNLKSNEYLGLDMPSDMNPLLEQEFIKKSIDRNWIIFIATSVSTKNVILSWILRE